jgi:predicted hydrocarbon binding protein
MKKADISRIDHELRTVIEKQFLMEYTFILTRVLIDLIGSEATVNEVRPHVRNSGHAFAINMTKMFDIEGSDLDKIGEICHLMEEIAGNLSHQEIERTDERIVLVSTSCPWKEGHKESCLTGHEMMEQAICEEINPEYTCRITQMITKGDPICSWVIEKKKK